MSISPDRTSIFLIAVVLVQCVLHEVVKTATTKVYTIIFPYDPATKEFAVFLQKRGAFKGLINGCGGKVDDGEHPHAAAWREVEEETGMQVNDTDIIHFLGTTTSSGAVNTVFVFPVDEMQRLECVETAEGIPTWRSVDDITRNIASGSESFSLMLTAWPLVLYSLGKLFESDLCSPESHINMNEAFERLVRDGMTITRSIVPPPLAFKFQKGSRHLRTIAAQRPGALATQLGLEEPATESLGVGLSSETRIARGNILTSPLSTFKPQLPGLNEATFEVLSV